MNILIVDDSRTMRMMVRRTLRQAGLNVDNAVEAENGKDALDKLRDFKPDLILSDWNMPELDGLSACRALRARGSRVPIVFLPTRGEELDRVLGLDLGGDDYLPKPFAPNELVSRVRAVLRRSRPATEAGPSAEADGVRVDLVAFRATAAGEELPLTRTELRMLHAVLSRGGAVLSRTQLVKAAYEGPHFVSERTVDSHVRGVRAKLRAAGVDRVETVTGVGWRWRRG